MRLSKPKRSHPPETYQAIIAEHQNSAVRLGEFLMACGWSLGDAGWAAANWDLLTLAVAVANERAKRNIWLTSFSAVETAKHKAEIETASTKKATAKLRPKRTTRIIRTSPKLNLPPQKSEKPNA